MLPTFCLRLAFGMIAPLGLLPAAVVPPRFFRVQFLVALGLVAIAGIFTGESADLPYWIALGSAAFLTLVGSIVWHTDEAPFGRSLFYLAGIVLLALLLLSRDGPQAEWLMLDHVAAACMLGSAISAMLMGHSYLIAPAMSLVPLNRLLGCLAVSLCFRVILACVGLWQWRLMETSHLDRETMLWLTARWGLGLLIPIVLTWMAWETARIRSTQSATGILYVVTIVCFLGELLSLLLLDKTGFVL